MTSRMDDGARGGWRASGNGGWRPRRVAARSVGEFLPTLMRPAFEKYGFSSAAILTDWAALAGPELAAYTAPERLKWPRGKPDEGEASSGQNGAILILRVSGARALEVEHRRPQIIERLNASFGYRAIGEIRVVQAPIEKREARPASMCAIAEPDHLPALSGIREERLRTAIARLAGGIEARRQRS